MRIPAALALLAAGCAGSAPPPAAPAPAPVEERRALTPEEYERIDTIIRQKVRVVNYCYDEELKRRRDRSFQGDVVLNIHVVPEGKAAEVEVKESTLKSPEVEQCIVDRVKSWEFGEVGADAWLIYPFHFEPQY